MAAAVAKSTLLASQGHSPLFSRHRKTTQHCNTVRCRTIVFQTRMCSKKNTTQCNTREHTIHMRCLKFNAPSHDGTALRENNGEWPCEAKSVLSATAAAICHPNQRKFDCCMNCQCDQICNQHWFQIKHVGLRGQRM